MNPPETESRKAFHELLDLLRELGDRYAGPEWLVQEPDDVGEALRAILHMLEASLLTRMESSPEHPWLREFPLPTRKFLGDNSDAIYYETAISPAHRYRLRGNMAGAAYVSITVEAGAPDGGFSQKTAGVINDTQFDVAEDGSFEIRIGGPPEERNWLELAPDGCRIVTRHYYEDDVPAAMTPRHIDFQIEVLDPAGPPEPPNDANVADAIRRVAHFMKTSILDMGPPPRENQPPFVSRVPNEFPEPVKPGDFGLAAADAAYSMAPFLIPPGQALVITGRWPEDCRSANVCLWNRHMQTLDYLNRPVSLNRRQTKPESDGSFRIVVAPEDPGVPNWLDNRGPRLRARLLPLHAAGRRDRAAARRARRARLPAQLTRGAYPGGVIDPADRTRLVAALEFALEKHGSQTRKGKEQVPYASHLLQVAGLVLEYGEGDVVLAQAALLHDVIEDHDVSEAELRERFGDEVARIVRSCSDLLAGDTSEAKGDWRERKERYVAHLREVEPRTRVVAACDKLHNLTNLVADVRVSGADFFERFTAKRDGTLWYYRAVREALGNELPAALARELDDRLAELERLAEANR